MTPSERKALHEACPYCGGSMFTIGTETGSEHDFSCDGYNCSQLCPVPVPIQVQIQCEWPGHTLIDALPEGGHVQNCHYFEEWKREAVPATPTHRLCSECGEQWSQSHEHKCDGSFEESAPPTSAAEVEEANRKADAHYEAKMEGLRAFAEAATRTAVEAAVRTWKEAAESIADARDEYMRDCARAWEAQRKDANRADRLESDRAERIAKVEEAAATVRIMESELPPFPGRSALYHGIEAIVAAAKGEKA